MVFQFRGTWSHDAACRCVTAASTHVVSSTSPVDGLKIFWKAVPTGIFMSTGATKNAFDVEGIGSSPRPALITSYTAELMKPFNTMCVGGSLVSMV